MSMGPQQGPLDKMFRDTNTTVLVIFGLCCGIIALILSIVGFVTAKDPEAKSKAQLVLIISAISSVAGTILGIINAVASQALLNR